MASNFIGKSLSSENATYNVLTIDTSATPGNFLIQTNLPYISGHQMPTIRIEGFPYGLGKTAHIDLVYYIYNNSFTSFSASSSGGWAPTISLANNNGNVCIHLSGGVYYPKMVVSVISGKNMMSVNQNMMNGWTWSDTACPTTNKVTVGYYSDFGGVIASGGSLTASGDVTAYSDARLKSDVVTFTNALDTVSQLRGVKYTKDGKPSTGVIAQEVEAVMPEVVHTADDEIGTKSVAYGNMVGVLVEAVKELKDIVNRQQTEIEELRNGK